MKTYGKEGILNVYFLDKSKALKRLKMYWLVDNMIRIGEFDTFPLIIFKKKIKLLDEDEYANKIPGLGKIDLQD